MCGLALGGASVALTRVFRLIARVAVGGSVHGVADARWFFFAVLIASILIVLVFVHDSLQGGFSHGVGGVRIRRLFEAAW